MSQRRSRLDLNSVSARLPCYFSNGPLKGDFWDIYLTTFFRVCKFKNTSAMRVNFFLKMFKIGLKFRKFKKKIGEKVFRFWDNWIWTCWNKLLLLRAQYLSSAVNALTNSPKILHITKRGFSNWISFTLINKYCKDALDHISTVSPHVYHVNCRMVLWNWTF